MPTKGDLRVWHIPQVPMKPFHVPVGSIAEARLVLHVLAEYDLFQYENTIKGDYASVNGLEVYDPELDPDGELDGWVEWFDSDGNDIKEII